MEELEMLTRIDAARHLMNVTTSSSKKNGTNFEDSTALRATMKTYGSTFLVLLLVFCFVQKLFPRLFAVRSWSESIKSDLALIQYGIFSWMWKVYWIDDDEIQDECGMDTLCFFRMLRFGRKLAMMGCFNSIWLIPLYRLAGNDAFGALSITTTSKALASISIVNVPTGSKRLVATVVAAYILFLYAMWLLMKEFDWYISYRHRFLQKRKARNYAVYVSGIPVEYRTSHKLGDYFRRCCAHEEDILEAHCALNIPNLESKVARRNALRQQLEHAQALDELKGSPVSRFTVSRHGVELIESVRSLQDELNALEREITSASSRRLREHDRFFSRFTRSLGRTDLGNRLGGSDFDIDLSDDQENEEDEASETEDVDDAEVRELADVDDAEVHELADVDDAEVPQSISYGSFDEAEISVDGDEAIDSNQIRDEQSNQLRRRQILSQSQHGNSSVSSHPDESNQDHDEQSSQSHRRQLLSQSQHGESSLSSQHKGSNKVQEDQSSRLLRRQLLSQSQHGESSLSSQPKGSKNVQEAQSNKLRRRQLLSQTQRWDSSVSTQPDSSHLSGEQLSRPSIKSFSSVLNEVKPDKLKHHIHHAGKSVLNEVKPDKLKEHIKHAGKSGVKTVKKAGVHGARQVKRVGEMGVENVLNMAEMGTNVVETAVTIVVGHEEGTPREAGFVVFTKMYAVHSALQMIHHPKPYVMEVSEAPEPDEIFWRNVGLKVEARRVGGYLSLAASAMLCFFWSLPVAFISSLTQVSSLEKSIPFLKRWVVEWPSLAPLLGQLAPLLLYLLNNLILPKLLTEFSKWEGLIGSSNLEASVFVKMSTFVIIQTFFVSAISGSIASELSNILNEPGQIFDLLANSLPGQSSYFLQIILVFTFTKVGFTMFRIGPLIQAWLRTKVGPRLTEKERNKKFLFIHSLANPPAFQHGQNTASFVITFMVTFVYATIAPITSCFLLACYILIESVFRLEFFRNFPVTSDSGGKLWMGFINIIIGCMVFAQVTLVGFLALKRAVAAFPLMVPLIVITILFGLFLNDKHIKVAKTLPTSVCLELDRQNEECGLTDFTFVHRRYLQPALQPGGGRDVEANHG